MTTHWPTNVSDSDEQNSVRDIIAETYREISGQTPSDSSKGAFLESLTLRKDQNASILTSFKQQRNFNLFLRAIETRCLVCFPHSVREKKWRFDEFASYVENRKKKPRVNLKLAKERMNWNKKVQINPIILFAIIPLLIGWVLSLPPIGTTILVALGISPILVLQYKDFMHFKRLALALELFTSRTD